MRFGGMANRASVRTTARSHGVPTRCLELCISEPVGPGGYRRCIGTNGGGALAKGDIETYHEDGVWKNRAQGGQRASNTAETKAEAEAAGRQMGDRSRR